VGSSPSGENNVSGESFCHRGRGFLNWRPNDMAKAARERGGLEGAARDLLQERGEAVEGAVQDEDVRME